MLSIVIKLDIQISGGRQLPPRHLQPSRDHLASLHQSEASSEATDQWEQAEQVLTLAVVPT